MPNADTHIAVVGAGIIGSWTALHLAESGVRTTLIEQFPLPHTRGSSHGMSRAFRYLGELEMARLDYSANRWQSLEKSVNHPLFVKTGLLNFGPPDDSELIRYMDILEQAGRPYEYFAHTELVSRFPMLRYPEEWGAAWDPDGGLLLAHRCLQAVQTAFMALGGKIMTAKVKAIAYDPESAVELILDHEQPDLTNRLVFDGAAVCAGPWTAKLIPDLASHLKTVLVPVTYWNDLTGAGSAANGFPVLFNARFTDMYGLPSYEYPGLVKILYHGGPDTDPDTRDAVEMGPFLEQSARYVRDHLPFLDSKRPAIVETCLYTQTPDHAPVIDTIGERLAVGCGFSGSGFKHSPATGAMLAAKVLSQENTIPSGFRADRYVLKRFQ